MKKSIYILILAYGISFSGWAQTGQVSVQQSDLIPQLVELKSEMTKDGKLGERYKIQVFYGDNNAASNMLQQVRSKYPDYPSNIYYETPNYKVWIGNFRNRLEADRALLKIKTDYPSAFIPKPQRG